MPTASYVKFQPAIENLFEGINAGSDSWAIKLATAVSAAAGTITEVANGNGYTTGGNAASVTSASQTGGTFKLVLASPTTWTATGAGFSFQYAVLVDTTTSTNVAYWDYGSSQTVAAGETVTVTLDPTNGVFQAT
jgi:galactitol-specific phosphotransferase system IIC component